MSVIGDLFVLGVIRLFGNKEQKENLRNSLCELAEMEAEFNEISRCLDRNFLKILSEELLVVPEKSKKNDLKDFNIRGFSNN